MFIVSSAVLFSTSSFLFLKICLISIDPIRVFDIFLEEIFFSFLSITWYQQIDSLSSFKPNRMVLPCSQGCPSSAASMSPSAVTVQYKLGWAFKGANVSQAGKIARQGRDGHGVDCGKGVGNTEREYSAPRSKWEPLPAM